MLVSHAPTLADARSCVAALSDQAKDAHASSAYERVILQLDRIHDDDVPAVDSEELPEDRELLLAGATTAIEQLSGHGVDALDIELVLATLDDAQQIDEL
ncbi:hypothetical protein [Nocardioides caldifontis]|uniref:hypothetical protein n=1 Tax=Nocardioides caldifontis TaxID=2588938 RepID=UPI0011DF24AB|nr:hypothetical protein [Nocardioides caldifontis]